MNVPMPAARPAAHFIANTWINDPNGLVYADGRYHLFFQHNPYGPTWGNMSWGHAVSDDLVTWAQLPTAIEATEEEYVFSGSAVVDHNNTSGLGQGGVAPMVAVYTGTRRPGADRAGLQAQCLAYSLDGGATWARSPRNPVLDLDSTETRDPKVFWYGGEDGHWVMVIVDAVVRQVRLFTSPDLHSWTAASTFGPLGAAEGVWECPDLFPITVADTGQVRWMLLVSVNEGAPARGSGTQYFVGDFDGVMFVPDAQHLGDDAEVLWVDHGPDCYAGVTFNDVPDGRRLLIAWADNWRYARHLAQRARRSGMTLVRALDLVATGDGRLRLRQQPVLPDPESPAAQELGVHTLDVQTRGSSEIRIGSELTISVVDGVLTCDRNLDHVRDAPNNPSSLDGDGSSDLEDQIEVRLVERPVATLTVVVDQGLVEIFADGGLTVVSVRIHPAPWAATRTKEVEMRTT